MEKAILQVAKELHGLREEVKKIRRLLEAPARTTVIPCDGEVALFGEKEDD